MGYEDWWNFFQVAGVALVAITFTVGALAFFTGYKTRQEKDRKAQEQRERIAELTKAAEEMHKKNLETELRLEEEKRSRLALENSIRPRGLVFTGLSLERLSKFKGTQYVLQYVADGEVERLANQIKYALRASDWVEVLPPIITNSEPNLVRIETKSDINDSAFAAGEIASYLEANGIDTMRGDFFSKQQESALGLVPDGAIKIRIGIKPDNYFTGKLMEEYSPLNPDRLKLMQELVNKSNLEQMVKQQRLREEWFPKPPKP